MRHKYFFYIVSVLFLLVALAHLLRVLFGWDLVLDIVDVPAWVSWVAVIVIGYLSYKGFRLAMSSRD